MCTYTAFSSSEPEASPDRPLLLLDNREKEWKHHSCGFFASPTRRTTFNFDDDNGKISADILQVDARFVSLIRWLGDNHIKVRLSGKNTDEGYGVYKIRELTHGAGTKLSASDGFFAVYDRQAAGQCPTGGKEDEDHSKDVNGDDMRLTSLQVLPIFLHVREKLCRTLSACGLTGTCLWPSPTR